MSGWMTIEDLTNGGATPLDKAKSYTYVGPIILYGSTGSLYGDNPSRPSLKIRMERGGDQTFCWCHAETYI